MNKKRIARTSLLVIGILVLCTATFIGGRSLPHKKIDPRVIFKDPGQPRQ